MEKTNKEKFLELVSENDTKTMELNRWRIENRKYIKILNNIKIALLMLNSYESNINSKN